MNPGRLFLAVSLVDVVLVSAPGAVAMEPAIGTPMGVASPDNSWGYPGHPHNGNYWIRSAFNPSDEDLQEFGPPVWRLVYGSAPPSARDKTFLITAGKVTLTPLPPYPAKHANGPWFAHLKSTEAGWIKVELVWRGQVVDESWYRFYYVNLIEDDAPQAFPGANYFGYDPRYGAKGVGNQFPAEGGNFWPAGNRPEVASEEHSNFHDLFAGLQSAWTGQELPPEIQGRVVRWLPEAQLLKNRAPSFPLNSLVAVPRNCQYTRVWIEGPAEPSYGPIPIWLFMTSHGNGEIEPGKPLAPALPSYEIKSEFVTPDPGPPAAWPDPSSSWSWPAGTPQIAPVPPVQRDHINLIQPFDRDWILRMPWKGHVDGNPPVRFVSSFYGDIEVELMIPNLADTLKKYDPSAWPREGIMCGRAGTVIELKELDVRHGHVADASLLKEQWFRRVGYTLHQDNLCAEPDMVTVSLGGIVSAGGTNRLSDTTLFHVKQGSSGPEAVPEFADAYFDEVMVPAVNRRMITTPDFDYLNYYIWTAAKWPQDALNGWHNATTGVLERPESVRMLYRGFTGPISRNPADSTDPSVKDFPVEPVEHREADPPAQGQPPFTGTNTWTTKEVDAHFINAITDVNNDGLVDHLDDDEGLEEGEGDNVGLLIHTEPGASDTPPEHTDESLREFKVFLSQPVAGNYADHQIWIRPLGGLGAGVLNVWKTSARTADDRVRFDASASAWRLDVDPGGGTVTFFVNRTVDETEANGEVLAFDLQIFLAKLRDGYVAESNEYWLTAMDQIRLTVVRWGLNMDNSVDYNIDHDDDVDEEIYQSPVFFPGSLGHRKRGGR